jgi:F-type H+-transporting ATPase subunit b
MKRSLRAPLFCAAIAGFALLIAPIPAGAAAETPANAQHDSSNTGEENKPDTEHQLAELSNEAAAHDEEHDEHAKFKYSAVVRALAAKTGMSVEAAYWTSVLLNFVIVAGALGFLVRKIAPGMFRDRTSAIQRGIEEARRASEDAQRRLNDIEGRLARLDSDIAAIESNAEAQAKDEEARLRTAVEDERKNIVRSAEQEITRAASNARRELKIYTTELAIGLAEKKIRVDAATDAEILREFAEQLEANGAPGRDS